jgi:hypothetical protein
MKIYEDENNILSPDEKHLTTTVTAKVDVTDAPRHTKKNKNKKIKSDQESLVLAHIRSILVSTGFNLNNDVFLPEEVVSAKNTPIDKPINLNHNDEDIVGHMTSSRLLDQEGNEVNAADDDLPINLDIEVEGVLYKGIFPEAVEAIIEGAKNGDTFVSMEALFTDFDFALEREGAVIQIPRNEETAFLTAQLKQFGGEGTFKGERLGRVLKNIEFIGKGIVAKPANPRSLIKEAARVAAFNDDLCVDDLIQKLKKGGDDRAMTDLEKELNVVRTERDKVASDLKESLDSVKELEEKVKSLSSEKDELTTSKDEEIQQLSGTVDELKNQLEELTKELDAFKTREADAEATRKSEERLAQLREVSQVADDKVEDTLARLKIMSDEDFTILLEMAKQLPTKEVEAEKPDDDEDKKADANKELDKVEASKDKGINPGSGESTEDRFQKAAAGVASILTGYKVAEGGEE